jgi:hypothetical protein
MTMQMKKYLLILFFLAAFAADAQDFVIMKVELAGDKVNIYYNLYDTISSRHYTIDLYSSKDNFVSKLEKVSGDIGFEVKPGGNHKITWDAKDELGADFEGKVGLEVRGRVYIPFVKVEGLNKTYKRKKSFVLTWTGGTQQNILDFDLYKGDEKIYPFSNVANVGQTEIVIPTSVKPGKDYYFKITDSKNKDQVVNTGTFSIKRKVPLLLKVLPIAIAGGLFAAFPPGGGNTAKEIPGPLDPTSIQH